MLGRNLSLFSGNSDEGPVLRKHVEGDSEDRRGRFKRSQDHHELYQKLIRWELDDELYATEKRLRDWTRERETGLKRVSSFRLDCETRWLAFRPANSQTKAKE